MTVRTITTAATIALAFTFASCNREQAQPDSGRPRTEPVRYERSANVQSYADVVDRVASSVVTIRSARRVRQPRQFPFFSDPSFEEFFGRRFRDTPRQQDRVQMGLGSGVIVQDDGYCVTNHHVIDGAEDIRIEFADGRTYSAKLVGSDPPSDLAVLKFSGSEVKPITLGNSDEVRVGDIALAIGNPLGIGQTVTAGIISAKGRTTGLSDGSFEDFLQTDAPINQGNSGGALVNTAGELIGINSQILSSSGGNIGIGFAIPVNMMRDVLDQLVKNGRVRRGQLGVIVQQITTDLARAMKLENRNGVLVSDVQSGSAADRAGVQRGDVITQINGENIQTTNELRNRVASLQPGASVKLTVRREGKTLDLTTQLGEFRTQDANQPAREEGGSQGGKMGMAVQPLTPAIASQLGTPAGTTGVVVREVDPGGPAAEAGLRPGDVIVQADRKPVRNTEDLNNILNAAGTNTILLLVNRRGRNVFIPIQPQ